MTNPNVTEQGIYVRKESNGNISKTFSTTAFILLVISAVVLLASIVISMQS
jgi:hypothetical protein